MLIELLRELQGDQGQEDFASAIGISQAMLNMVYAGTRRPGMKVMAGLVRLFPSKRNEITTCFFAPEYNNSCVETTDDVEGLV